MPLYVADYLSDTGHLTAAESGAYLHLIMHYWLKGGLPDDDSQLARIARMQPDEWSAARRVLVSFFHDGWKHSRIEAEIARSEEKYEKRAAAGRKGGTSKRGSNAEAMLEHCSSETEAGLNQPQSHSSPLREEEEMVEDRASAVDLKILATRLFSAGGVALNRAACGLESMATPSGWLQQGCDLEADILPTVSLVSSRAPPGSIRKWSYFAQAVSDARSARTKPLPQGQARHGKPEQNRIFAALDRLDERIAAARSGDRGDDRGNRPGPPELSLVAG